MKPICIDFDGTCVDHAYPEVGEDAPHAVRVLRLLAREYKLILCTMRFDGRDRLIDLMGESFRDVVMSVPGGCIKDTLSPAVEWFSRNDVPLYGINQNPDQLAWTTSPKPWGLIYIDDCGFGCPLIEVEGFNRLVVDWLAVERELLCTN